MDEVGGFDESFDQFEDWDFLIRLSARTRFHHLPAVTAVYRLRDDASNITAAQPWHTADAQNARRRVFEKHAARRSISTELALVDSLEADFYAVRDAAAASPLGERGPEEGARGAARAALARPPCAPRRPTPRCGPGSPRRASRRSPSRTRTSRADVAKLEATVDQIVHSRVWRLFTPWWKLKGLLPR